ncbi:hypothetical protein B0J17DRAFT_629069 [Rhizoctonia solani]|nr:hypothetical protein B0J17DRAFT_629069 [Rhizoctonia solani]
MPAVRQHEALVSSSATSSSTSLTSKSNGSGVKNVWFYMTGARTPTRPHDDEIHRYFEQDNLRQRTGLTYQRPQDTRIRCVVCLLEKDKWQTWHNRAGPIAKILRQHLDGRHAIICTDDMGDQSTEPQQSAKPTSSKDKSEASSSSGKLTATEKPHAPDEAPRPGRPKSVGRPSSPKFPTPSSSEESEQPKQGETSKPRPRAPKSVEILRVELDKVKAECEQVKAERDREARERRILKEEVRRLKDVERARDEEILRVSNLLSSSLQALVKKQSKS